MAFERLYFDIGSRRFTDAGGSTLNSLDAKRGDLRRFELAVQKNGQARDLPGSTLRLSVKNPKNLAGSYLATATGTKSGSATFTRWFFDLDLNTTELTTLLAGETSPVLLSLELEIVLPDVTISSVSLPFSVEPDINRGGESIPSSTDPAALAALLDSLGLTTLLLAKADLVAGKVLAAQLPAAHYLIDFVADVTPLATYDSADQAPSYVGNSVTLPAGTYRMSFYINGTGTSTGFLVFALAPAPSRVWRQSAVAAQDMTAFVALAWLQNSVSVVEANAIVTLAAGTWHVMCKGGATALIKANTRIVFTKLD